MTAFRVDDGMYDHPKFEGLSDSAVALWTRAGSWCGRYLNGGYVPEDRIGKLGYTVAQAEELVAHGIWKNGPPPGMSTGGLRGGFHFHQWFQHQPSKEDVEANREKWRSDKKRQRANPKAKPEMSTQDKPVDSVVESRNGMDLSSESEISSLSSQSARAVPAEWTASAQHVAFVRAFEKSQATPPSMGGRQVGGFHAKVLRTAELQDVDPAALFSAALATWLAKSLSEVERKAPYACFESAWGDLTSKASRADLMPLGKFGRPGQRPRMAPATTEKDFEDTDPVEQQLERLRNLK